MNKTDIKFISFALPDIGGEEIAEVIDSMRSGWLTTGPKTKKFEKDFASYIGGGVQVMAVNSATAGLHLALEACGIKAGDEVITSTYTFTSTAEVIRYLGAHPVFIDIDPATCNMDASLIEAAITPRTKAIMPVHIGGYPCDMDRIVPIARAHGLKIIEDAAHAFPVCYKDRIIGSLDTDCTVFSFYATKTITTGEGGMVVTNSSDLARRIKIMRLHGIDRDAFNRYTSEKPAWYYEIVAPGYKYNMSDICASMGIHQLRKAELFKKKRTAIAERYSAAFSALPVSLPAAAGYSSDHAWHLYQIKLNKDAPVTRNEFIQEMSRNAIGCSVHFIPLHIQPYYKELCCTKPQDLPEAYDVYKREISLPIYTKMTEEDVDRVINSVRKILGK